MKGRRLAALLCVLLAHALAIYGLVVSFEGARRGLVTHVFWSEPITPLEPEPTGFGTPPPPDLDLAPADSRIPEPDLPAGALAESDASGAITGRSRIDWPLEGKKAAEREVARELEAERIAKMFAGPQGTWASLTKRQRSKLNKFRWKPGVTG
ncbi:MAG TPA: hypothetical protein VFP37_15880, partial [Steroidobacteraceae bacterium]|nr:hypothetical protein [Steroidobacteraceae bacterium]